MATSVWPDNAAATAELFESIPDWNCKGSKPLPLKKLKVIPGGKPGGRLFDMLERFREG